MVRPTYVGFRKAFFALAIILLAFSIFAPIATVEAGEITYFEGDIGKIHVIASVQKNAVYNKFIFGDDWIVLRYRIKGADPKGIEIKVEKNKFIMEFEECRIVWQKIPHMDALKFSFIAKQDIKGLEIKFKVAKSLKVHGHRLISKYLYFDVSDALKWVQSIDVSNKRVRIKDIPAGAEIDPSIGVISGDAEPLRLDLPGFQWDDSNYYRNVDDNYKNVYMEINPQQEVIITKISIDLFGTDSSYTIRTAIYDRDSGTYVYDETIRRYYNDDWFSVSPNVVLKPNTNGYYVIWELSSDDGKTTAATSDITITLGGTTYYHAGRYGSVPEHIVYYKILESLDGTYEAKDGYNATYRWNGSISVAPQSLEIYLPKGYNITYVNVSDGSTTVNVTSGFTYNDYNDTHWKIPIDLSSYSFSAPVDITVGAETVNAIYDIDAPLVASDDDAITVKVCLRDGLGNALSQDVSLRVYLPDNPDQPVFWDKTHQHLITFHNGPQKTAYGWSFDGVDDYASVNDFWTTPQNFTVISFVRLHTKNISQGIVSQRDYEGWRLYVYSDGAVNFDFKATDGNYHGVPLYSYPYDGNYHLIAGRYDGSEIAVFLDDNKAVKSEANLTPVDVTVPIIIGATYTGADPTLRWFVDGEIAFIMIYNRALSNDEITQIYNDIKDFSWDNPITDGLVFAFTPDMPLASGSEVWNATVTSDSSGTATFEIPYNVTTPGYLTVEAITTGSWKGVITSTITVLYNESLDNFNRTWEVYNDTHIKYTWNVSLPDAPGYRLWIRQGYENITAEGFTLKDGYLERLSPGAGNYVVTAYALNSIRSFTPSTGYDYITVSGKLLDPLNNPISDQAVILKLYYLGEEIKTVTVYPDSNGNFSYTFTNLTAGESYKIVVWTNYWAGYKELLVSLPELPSSGGGGGGGIPPEWQYQIQQRREEEGPKPIPAISFYGFVGVIAVVGLAMAFGQVKKSRERRRIYGEPMEKLLRKSNKTYNKFMKKLRRWIGE